ncbi:MAG: hypothetical protein OXI33_11300 [Chloroflexota bacterium]|nr:hypothetical protein [Chloroflexota bacterium]
MNKIWQAIETTDIEMSDASERIRERRVTPDNAEKVTEFSQDPLMGWRGLYCELFAGTFKV